MNRWTPVLAAALALILAQSAHAFPPTATVSPGYDRALAESRRARQAQPPAHVVIAPQAIPARKSRRHR